MPSFNWRLALQSGYSPEEIQAHLDKRGLSDEALIQRQLGGKPMLPYTYAPDLDAPPPAAAPPPLSGMYGPPASVPGSVPQTGERRNMSPQEIDALWTEQGIQPELTPPMSLKDLAFEPAMSFLQDANASQYLLPAALLGMVRYKRPGVSAAARDAAEKYHHAPVHDPIQVPLTPNVAKAELLKRRLDPEEEMMLYHSGTADIDESIRQNWLQPQTGDWVKESLAGAVDDPEFAEELARGGAVWMSAVPDWVKAKVARKVGKHVTDVTPEDIRQHGQLTMIRTEKDAPIVRRLEDDDYVENLRGQKQRWWESDLYDYDKRREIPYGVERGDYFAVEDIEPSHTLTGQDLINFLTRNYPATLSDLAKKNRARFGEHPASMSLGQMAKGPVPLSRAADIERVTEEFGKSGSYSWAKNGWNWAGDGRLGYGETKLGNYARRRVDIPDGVKVNRDASGDLHSIEYWKDGMQVGMLDITDRGVSDIAVIPPMQRQGIGSQLLQAAIDNGIQSINTPSISEAGFGLVKKVTDTKPLKQSKK